MASTVAVGLGVATAAFLVCRVVGVWRLPVKAGLTFLLRRAVPACLPFAATEEV